MKEEQLEQLFENNEISRDLEKRIKRKMNRNIYKKSILTFVVLCLIIVGGYFGVNKTITNSYYNPFDETGLVVYSNEDCKDSSFELLVLTVFNVFYPGYSYISYNPTGGATQNTDLGQYITQFQVHDRLNRLNVGKHNATLTISKGNLNIEFLEDVVRWMYQFDNPELSNDYQGATDDVKNELEDLRELPDSVRIKASFSFEKCLSLEELIEFMKEYEDTEFNWMAIDGQESSKIRGIAGGTNLNELQFPTLSEEVEKQYPDLLLEGELTADQLKNHYLSQLQILIDHPDFLSMWATYDEDLNRDSLIEKYNRAKESMEVYGLSIVTTKQDLISMIEEGIAYRLLIEDVKLSKYSR